MKIPEHVCKACSQGFTYPVLVQSGWKGGWYCPVCRTHYNGDLEVIENPTKRVKTWQDKLTEYWEDWGGD